jgi:alpha-tubulin suppressor-like RCC1 family protein
MHLFRSLALSAAVIALTACNSGSSSHNDDPQTPETPGAQQWVISATASAGGSVAPALQRIEEGQTATLTVAANSGYNLDAVTGCGGTLDGTTYTTAPATADCAIAASFSVIPGIIYNVSATTGTGGSVDTPTQSVEAGATASFTLIPAEGFAIDTVQGCDGTLNGNTYTTGVVAADCAVTATFIARYTIVGNAAAGGNITPPTQTINAGLNATLTVTPNAGFAIDTVTGCGGSLAGTTFTTAPATTNCSVNASFVAMHTVTVNSGGNGSVTPGTQQVRDGDTIALTITPAAGYIVDSVDGCGVANQAGAWETATITANCAINASFRRASGIAAGGFHTCSLFDTAGSVINKCWGQNSSGQLGVASFSLTAHGDEAGEAPIDNDPFGVVNGLSVVSMALGRQHSCAILSDAQLYCWGENQNGQLGVGTNADRKIMTDPVDLGGKVVAQVSAGGQFTCARLADGTVQCWGLNSSGELGNGNANTSFIPTSVPAFASPVQQIAAGGAHACARLQNNEVYCWGDNSSGQLGDSDGGNDSATPAIVVSLGGATITDLAAGGLFGCVIANSQVRCWGENGSGQLGNNDGTNTDLDVPSAALNLGGQLPLKLALGGEHGCVLTTIGTVYCWGESDAGQTGQNDTTDDIAPALVNLGANYADYTVVDISAGADHTCVVLQPTDPLDTTRPIRCWGEGGVGQLGLEDTSDIGDDEVVDNAAFNVQI